MRTTDTWRWVGLAGFLCLLGSVPLAIWII